MGEGVSDRAPPAITRVVGLGDRFPSVLKAAQQGEPEALEGLYRALAPGVLGYLRGQCSAEPEDATSEVFVGMVRGIRSFRGGEREFRSWVFSIAHRRLLDARRRLARRREEAVDPEDLAGTLAAASTGDAEREAMDRLGTAWAVSVVRSLTDDQRAVLLLRVVADLSVAEVAGVLGKSLGAVKTLQRRALLSLARKIDRKGVS
jgi:RNA polymerase sigma factor (sigma-70 family)